jgi:hypothetical protein
LLHLQRSVYWYRFACQPLPPTPPTQHLTLSRLRNAMASWNGPSDLAVLVVVHTVFSLVGTRLFFPYLDNVGRACMALSMVIRTCTEIVATLPRWQRMADMLCTFAWVSQLVWELLIVCGTSELPAISMRLFNTGAIHPIVVFTETTAQVRMNHPTPRIASYCSFGRCFVLCIQVSHG